MSDCFVHASDLHLDAPLGNLGLLDEQRRRDLSERAAKAWDNLVNLCVDEDASFLVLAGDIFDDAMAGVDVQSRLNAGLRRLDDARVAVFVCHGNHDPVSEGFRPIGDLPGRVVRFDPGTPQSHPVTLRNSRDSVLVSGVSFATRHETNNLAVRFAEVDRNADAANAPHVAVLHANVGGDPDHDPYAPCSYDDLDRAAVQYWALGHIHKRYVRPLGGGRWAAYCGNLQGRSFKPAECEPKGALVVPVAHGRIDEPRFEPCDELRFVRDEVAVKPEDSIVDVQDRLLEAAAELGSRHAPLPVVWEVRLTGTSEEAARLREAAAANELTSAISEDLSQRLGGGGLCRLEAAVRTAVNREAVMSGGDLRAEVLHDLQRLRGVGLPRRGVPVPGAEVLHDLQRLRGVGLPRRGVPVPGAEVLHDLQRLRGPAAVGGGAITQPGISPTDSAAADSELQELLRAGLPFALSDVWQEVLERRPDRLGDVLDLADELLLQAFAETEAERP